MTTSVSQKVALAEMTGFLSERGFKSTGRSAYGFFEAFTNSVDYQKLAVLVSVNVSATHNAHWIASENGVMTVGSFRCQNLVNYLIRRNQ
jgi:hypothetical protein